ncbi:hypothetical protein V5N11_009106 [Cardamine amara subsp. amara]|uniref:RNase H type-1 domain-containing protein n=1 Tax=Cardamine amara subsp. amara TaxID=228776 RepID=A0ABD1C7N0_CARAN
MFFQCDYAKAIWRSSNTPIPSSPLTNSLEQNLGLLLDVYESSSSPEIRYAPFWILWQIWKSRNDLIFNKINHDRSTVISRTMDNVYEWLGANTITQAGPTTIPPSNVNPSWQPPPSGSFKCNVDASFHYNLDYIGVSWVLRDDLGMYKLSGSLQRKQGSNSLEAEAMALLHAIKALWCRGYRNVIMEVDCRNLYDLLHNHSVNASITPILSDIRSWADHYTNISLQLYHDNATKSRIN